MQTIISGALVCCSLPEPNGNAFADFILDDIYFRKTKLTNFKSVADALHCPAKMDIVHCAPTRVIAWAEGRLASVYGELISTGSFVCSNNVFFFSSIAERNQRNNKNKIGPQS